MQKVSNYSHIELCPCDTILIISEIQGSEVQAASAGPIVGGVLGAIISLILLIVIIVVAVILIMRCQYGHGKAENLQMYTFIITNSK